MRLLELDDNGALHFSKNYIDAIPPYAILSHTWGPDEEEVTFDDIRNGTGQNKAGYTKITFCARLAKENGLQSFWIDTCCINKMDFTELTEAINSMFKWYRDAVKCFVYLSDVSVHDQCHRYTATRPWEASFRRSRWFTRGWTLQELLAPESVEFFTCEGERLCDRNTMAQVIHEITNIPTAALDGTVLARFSAEERMRWVEKRVTTKREDKAYCLLGIFGVYMPLIYGEGENAMFRLEKEIASFEGRSHSLFSFTFSVTDRLAILEANNFPIGSRIRSLPSRPSGVPKLREISAAAFVAVHDDEADTDHPNMRYWYREDIEQTGYPACVHVGQEFQNDNRAMPVGTQILSLRRIANLLVRAECHNIVPGLYRVEWLLWFWAGRHARSTSQGFDECFRTYQGIGNEVTERNFLPDTHGAAQTLPGFFFPWNLRLNVGQAKNPVVFMHAGVDRNKNSDVPRSLLVEGYGEQTIDVGLWGTMRNTGWVKADDTIIQVSANGYLAFIASIDWTRPRWIGGVAFGGIRLKPISTSGHLAT